MVEITAAELRKLRALESRISTANETLSDVRTKRDEARAEASDARREVRDAQRELTKLQKQITDLVDENAAMADELDVARRERSLISDEAAALRSRHTEAAGALKASQAELGSLKKELRASERAKTRLEKQLAVLGDKLEGKEAPELTPDHLSGLLGGFIQKVGGQTGLDVTGTQLKLRVGFTGRGGGAFVIPTAGVDPEKLPELHEIRLDLGSRGFGDIEALEDEG